MSLPVTLRRRLTRAHAPRAARSNSPERRLDLTVRRRGGEMARLPVMPELAADGGGRIGVQLSTNAKLSRRVAAGPGQALAMAGGEFRKLLNVVTMGARRTLTPAFTTSRAGLRVAAPPQAHPARAHIPARALHAGTCCARLRPRGALAAGARARRRAGLSGPARARRPAADRVQFCKDGRRGVRAGRDRGGGRRGGARRRVRPVPVCGHRQHQPGRGQPAPAAGPRPGRVLRPCAGAAHGLGRAAVWGRPWTGGKSCQRAPLCTWLEGCGACSCRHAA